MAPPSYDLVVIGGGAGGLTSAGVGASLGASTLLIERDRLGGDCTWTGCIPSKTLLKSAHTAHEVRNAKSLGVDSADSGIDFQEVMRQVRQIRQQVYEEADAPERLADFGIDVMQGDASFRDAHTLRVDQEGATELIRARYIIIATGARPSAPPINGLAEAGFLDNHSLFEIDKQPERLAIIGAGPIGTEMAQAFQRLGTRVTVIEQSSRILQHDHPRLAGMLKDQLEMEGVTYHLEAKISSVTKEKGETVTFIEKDESPQTIRADALLVATGRQPNVEGLQLDAAGVTFDREGVAIDEKCRTSVSHIYAVGDVTGRYQFTHMSEHMGKTAVTNALLKFPQKLDRGRVPWVTYTDPELAHVGASEQQLQQENTGYETYCFPLDRLDRAICERAPKGEIRIYATKLRGKILGADVLAPRAGELIGTVAVAMKAGATLRQIADTIFPYPTYGQGVRRAADQWYAQKQKPWLVRGIQKVFGYDGAVMEPDSDRIV